MAKKSSYINRKEKCTSEKFYFAVAVERKICVMPTASLFERARMLKFWLHLLGQIDAPQAQNFEIWNPFERFL
jgi:hypothetical protein